MRTAAARARLRRGGSDGATVTVTAIGTAAFTIFVALPLVALLVRAPWSALPDVLSSPAVRSAMRLSLVVSLSATLLAVGLGTPLAWVLARVEFPGRSIVRALVLVPMVLPPVVGGVALLLALGRRGVVGTYLERWFDVTLPFSTAGAVVAATFVALPFLVITVEAALRTVDTDLEQAAATLGATRLTIWRRVTLPAIAPSLVAGAALAWARALGEFGATITFAGNLEGRTQTMPLAVFQALETDRDAAIALSLVLLAISVIVLAVVGRHALGGTMSEHAES